MFGWTNFYHDSMAEPVVKSAKRWGVEVDATKVRQQALDYKDKLDKVKKSTSQRTAARKKWIRAEAAGDARDENGGSGSAQLADELAKNISLQ